MDHQCYVSKCQDQSELLMNWLYIVSQTSKHDSPILWGKLEHLSSFTVGCKTDDGLTVILVERGPGVETRQIKTSYSTAAGTGYITFDNVRVPVGNTLGQEGGGIFVILRYAVMVCIKWGQRTHYLIATSTTSGGSCPAVLHVANA
jgi:hypothetical protein